MTRTTRFFTISMLAAGLALAQAERSAEVQLKAAMHKEQVEGDLKAAIKLYQSIVEKFAGDKAVAAKALLQMGQCYEKLGQADARKTYEQLLRQYADQNDIAAEARTRLSALERAEGSSRPLGATLRKVWAAGNNGIVEGSPSPDGRYLSFTDWETGDLALRDLATGQNRHLTGKGSWKDSGEFAEASAISNDGKQVAFSWFNKDNFYDLRVIGMDGSQPRVVFRDKGVAYHVMPYGWSADGKQILAVLFHRYQDETRIALISADGGSARVLKTLADYPRYVSLSPDGRFLVYDALGLGEGRERDIFLLSVDGGQEIPLVRHPADDFAAIWMPDGKRVLFASDRTGTNGFWVLDVVDGKPKGDPQLLKDNVGRRILLNGFTRQGSLYYSVNAGTEDLYIAETDPAAGKILRQPALVCTRFANSNSDPSWSPDGQRLAYYYSQRYDTPWTSRPTLVIHSLETGEERDVPVTVLQIPFPVSWFPDGKSVLVRAWDNLKTNQIACYRVDIQTGEHRLIQSFPRPIHGVGDMSPDGKILFFLTGEGPKLRGAVVARDIQTGQERDIASVPYLGEGTFARLIVSPDGKYLLLRLPVDENQWTALRLVPATGGEWHELCRFPMSEFSAASYDLAWTSDGRNVLIVRRTGKEGTPELWRIPVAGGEPQKTGLSMEDMRLVAPHPDGRRIALDTGRPDDPLGEVWVLENFLPALKSAR